MRISGGTAKGRAVGLRKAFSQRAGGTDLRPTPAKVRKAIFDILGDRVIRSRFLDLYAGSGAVGLEALSRGAEQAVFVESDPVRARIIRDTAERFGFSGQARVVVDEVRRFLRRSHEQFDIIFADPPYASAELELIMPEIDRRRISGDGVVILERQAKKEMPSLSGELELVKAYRYGDTALSLYRLARGKEEGNEEQ